MKTSIRILTAAAATSLLAVSAFAAPTIVETTCR
jgi:hypothetical protein